MRIWKWVGLAGVVGVTAVGIAAGTATVRRKRRIFVDANPDELRIRLHERLRKAEERQGGVTRLLRC
ncbi:MAG: hypothetical protein P8O03_11950 [Ilumatobacter sp.]|nr:hypothetical protein [bacterium]MDG1267026.1 hypothetical protein [Ilumatobacter sp.]MDG2040338.1 hypothetical protein [Ilumatobacter sp.]NKB41092.1 hypothetical protein [Ilumatobacter sp.]